MITFKASYILIDDILVYPKNKRAIDYPGNQADFENPLQDTVI